MALVICPDCKKEISQKAEMCPHCGFPVKNFIVENKIDVSKVLICPKCAALYGKDYIQFFPSHLQCEECGTTLITTNEDIDEMFTLSCTKKYFEKYTNRCVELAKQYGNNQFDEDTFNERLQRRDERIAEYERNRIKNSTPINTPKCPTCGSTNIQKIGAVERGASILGLGLFSKKINKTYKCKNCGLTW